MLNIAEGPIISTEAIPLVSLLIAKEKTVNIAVKWTQVFNENVPLNCPHYHSGKTG
jgi:hypothetical protein